MLNFSIPEKLFILSIDDEKNTISASARNTLRYGLIGGLLAEMALANKIQLQDGRLVQIDTTSCGDIMCDEILARIAAERKPRKIKHWLNTLSRKQSLKEIAVRLVERKVIRIEKKHYLWVIPYEVYPQVDTSAKYWLKQHLRAVVLASEKGEAADICLLSLLKACRLSRLLFTRDERKYASKKVDALVKGEVFGGAVASLLQEIEAAAAAAAAAAAS